MSDVTYDIKKISEKKWSVKCTLPIYARGKVYSDPVEYVQDLKFRFIIRKDDTRNYKLVKVSKMDKIFNKLSSIYGVKRTTILYSSDKVYIDEEYGLQNLPIKFTVFRTDLVDVKIRELKFRKLF